MPLPSRNKRWRVLRCRTDDSHAKKFETIAVARTWKRKRIVAAIAGSAGVALLLIIIVGHSDTHGARRGFFPDPDETLPPGFLATLVVEDAHQLARLHGIEFKADFVGIDGPNALFADIIASRRGRGIASYRTPIGTGFEMPVSNEKWVRVTVKEITLSPLDGTKDSEPLSDLSGEPTSLPTVILVIEDQDRSQRQDDAPSGALNTQATIP